MHNYFTNYHTPTCFDTILSLSGNLWWHDSVEKCRSVIICEIIVNLLVIVQNNKRYTVQRIEIMEAQRAKIYNKYKITGLNLLKTNAGIWFNRNM